MDEHAFIEDVAYSSGVLKIEFQGGKSYVINKQTPNKQIWLSSPVSGPQRYEFDPESRSWLNVRNEKDLLDVLNEEVVQLFETNIKLY